MVKRPGRLQRRLLAASLSVGALAAILAIVASAPMASRQDGPIRYDGSAGVTWAVARDQPFTWTMPLPPNPTSEDIYLRSIEPVGTKALELLGVLVAYGCGLPTTDFGFPPPGVTISPVDGAILPANGDPCDTPTAVIGLRRDQSATSGVIEGLRMRYESDGTAYETILALHLLAPDP